LMKAPFTDAHPQVYCALLEFLEALEGEYRIVFWFDS